MKFAVLVCKYSLKMHKCTVTNEAKPFLPLDAMVEGITCGFTFVNKTQQR